MANPTGGDITTDGDYKVHTFTSSSNFVVSSGSADVVILIVGGGGGGGDGVGGGGGMMSDCDVQRMEDYMSNPWEPDSVHESLAKERDNLKAEVQRLRDALNAITLHESAGFTPDADLVIESVVSIAEEALRLGGP